MLFLYTLVLFEGFYTIESIWPAIMNTSRISLLGLFQDAENTSEPTDLSIHSRAMFKSAIILAHRYNLSIGEEYLGYESAQTGGDMIVALKETCKSLVNSNIIGIVGPSVSREASIIGNYGEKMGIPVISYAATDPDLSDRNAYSTFYRTVPSDQTAAIAIGKLFVRFNWTTCTIIYQNDQFGTGALKVFNEQLTKMNFIVRETILFDINTKQIRGNLKTLLLNSGSRIIIVWAESIYTSIIIQNAIDDDVLGPLYTWILSSSITFDQFNSSTYEKLIGILTVEPVTASIVNASINSTLLNSAYDIWQEYELNTFPGPNNVDYYALFAFDATWTLIQSLRNLSSIEFENNRLSSDCFNQYLNNSKILLNTINEIDFLGVSGRVKFSVNQTDRVNGSYYYCRNVQYKSTNQLQFIPILDYSELTDWKSYSGSNLIVWPGNTLTIPSDRAILKGVTLEIGVIRSLPFVIVDTLKNNQTKVYGYILDLIEELKNKIGFIPNIHLQPTNQTYANLINLVATGVYDMVIGDVTITAKRRESVGFSNSIFDNSLRILMKKSSEKRLDLLSYLKPFSTQLWLIICLTWLCSGILFCLIERAENESLQNQFILSSFALSLWFAFGNIVGYGIDFHPRTPAGRLLTVALYILSLILVASYTANLASDLTVLKSKDLINGIEDIKSGKIPANRIGIRVGTASEDFYLREISGGVANFYPLNSRQETYDRLLDGTIDLSFVDVGNGEYITNNVYCNLTLVGTGFDEGAFGIVVQKQWIYTQDLDVNILSLKEAGILNKLRQEWFQVKNCPDSNDYESTAMTIQSMAGLFLTFAVIFTLALIIFLLTRLKFFAFCFLHLKNIRKK